MVVSGLRTSFLMIIESILAVQFEDTELMLACKPDAGPSFNRIVRSLVVRQIAHYIIEICGRENKRYTF